MFNLRFKCTVISSWRMVLHAVPKANKMIANKSRYSEKERFAYAKWIINYMRKRARTRTKVYGRENIPTDSNYIMYPNHQGKYDALGIILAQDKPCGVLWGKKQAERLMSRQVCGLIDAVVIDLDNNRDKVRAIMDVTRQVRSGRNFLIFPEGGYTDNKNELQEFQAGCFSCSLQSKTPIVPVAIFDSYKSMNSNTFERVDTQVHFLKPILYSEYGELKKKEVAELIDTLSTCYDRDGMDETIVVCRSNKRANIYNNGIRAQILWREDELNTGDLLMVAKNNYYWTEKSKEMDFIANGEIAVLRRMRRTRELYGFRFAEVLLAFPDYGDFELEVNLLLDTLHTDAPALPKADNDRLFYAVLEDYADISMKRDRMKKMKADPHYNALQVKYAYAVTCHKAQGGQWKNVFLDQGYMTDEYLTPDYFRWLYTAFTRATGTLYLVNYPKEQIL